VNIRRLCIAVLSVVVIVFFIGCQVVNKVSVTKEIDDNPIHNQTKAGDEKDTDKQWETGTDNLTFNENLVHIHENRIYGFRIEFPEEWIDKIITVEYEYKTTFYYKTTSGAKEKLFWIEVMPEKEFTDGGKLASRDGWTYAYFFNYKTALKGEALNEYMQAKEALPAIINRFALIERRGLKKEEDIYKNGFFEYRNPFYDYTLKIPNSWKGKYSMEETEKEISFYIKSGSGSSAKFMSIIIYPQSQWDKMLEANELLGPMEEFERKNGLVFVHQFPLENPYCVQPYHDEEKEKEYDKLSQESYSVLNTFSFDNGNALPYVYEDSIYGYALDIPEWWRGRYGIEETNRGVVFWSVVDDKATHPLFEISVYGKLEWEMYKGRLFNTREILNTDDFVYVYKEPPKNKLTGKYLDEYKEVAGSVKKIINSIRIID